MRAIGALARLAAGLVLLVVFFAVITPLSVGYRWVRRRDRGGWRPAPPPRDRARYFRPY